MSTEATLDRFGRIVLPKVVRDHLGLEPGAVLEIEESRGEIRLKPLREEPILVRKGRVLVYTGKAGGDLVEAVKAAREGRAKKLLSRAWPKGSR